MLPNPSTPILDDPRESASDPAEARVTAPPGGSGGSPLRALTIGIVILAVLGVAVALYLGRVVLLPLATAVMLSLVLRPIVRALARWGFPNPLSALILVALISGGVVGVVFSLSGPAQEWLKEAPHALRQLQYRIGELKQPIEDVRTATKQVEKLGDIGDEDATKVVVQNVDLPGRIAVELRETTIGVFTTLITLFFVLGWGRRLYRNLVIALPHFGNRRTIVGIAQEIEQSVSVYLSTITAINLILGAVVALVLYLLGMPNPALWGLLTAIFNYVPYLGPAMTALVLSFVALTTYPTIGEAAIVPLVFLMITSIEGYVITPMAVGSRLTLNPLVIFVSLIFWFWIWGIIGGLLTVPLLVCGKIAAEHLFGREVSRVLD